jgi:predicted RNase H-like HicB family nuclease
LKVRDLVRLLEANGWRRVKTEGSHRAYAPDLHGVITTGPTPEATERSMREAIAFHLRELRASGEPIPVPTARATYVAAR